MSDPFIGEIRLFAYSLIPSGWLACDGSLLPVNDFEPLFSLIGDTYGGDGQVTFALPDLRGRVPVSMGTQGNTQYSVGGAGGAETVALSLDEMPPHGHNVRVSTSTGSIATPANSYFAVAAADAQVPPVTPSFYAAAAPATVLAAGTVGSAGGGMAHNNIQPSLVLAYCIATAGTYPSRS